VSLKNVVDHKKYNHDAHFIGDDDDDYYYYDDMTKEIFNLHLDTKIFLVLYYSKRKNSSFDSLLSICIIL